MIKPCSPHWARLWHSTLHPALWGYTGGRFTVAVAGKSLGPSQDAPKHPECPHLGQKDVPDTRPQAQSWCHAWRVHCRTWTALCKLHARFSPTSKHRYAAVHTDTLQWTLSVPFQCRPLAGNGQLSLSTKWPGTETEYIHNIAETKSYEQG